MLFSCIQFQRTGPRLRSVREENSVLACLVWLKMNFALAHFGMCALVHKLKLEI